jgi:hypothetical protein
MSVEIPSERSCGSDSGPQSTWIFANGSMSMVRCQFPAQALSLTLFASSLPVSCLAAIRSSQLQSLSAGSHPNTFCYRRVLGARWKHMRWQRSGVNLQAELEEAIGGGSASNPSQAWPACAQSSNCQSSSAPPSWKGAILLHHDAPSLASVAHSRLVYMEWL